MLAASLSNAVVVATFSLIDTTIMFPSLEQKLHRYEELEKQLEDPMLLSDIDRMLEVQKEFGGLTKVAEAVRRFQSLEEDIEAAEMMVEEETD